MTCTVSDCDRRGWRDGLCRAHWQRRHRGRPLDEEIRPYGREPVETFRDAVLDLLDLRATDDEGWRRGWKRIETAARRAFGRSRTM